MARTGKITLYEGIGKVSKKPFKALKLDIAPGLSKLYFLDSRYEMDAAVAHLEGTDDPSDEVIDLEDDAPKGKKNGLFN